MAARSSRCRVITLTELCRSASPISAVGSRHENTALRLLPHQHRQRPDVIEMRMRNRMASSRPVGEQFEIRQAPPRPPVFRMHSAIEHEPCSPTSRKYQLAPISVRRVRLMNFNGWKSAHVPRSRASSKIRRLPCNQDCV